MSATRPHQVPVLTPDPADVARDEGWREVFDRLAAALARGGLEAVPTPWTAHVADGRALAAYPLVLPLLAWGYHHRHAD